MISQYNKNFLVDIINEVQRMDVITRNCLSLLQCLKPGLPYNNYITLFDSLAELDDAIRYAYEAFFDFQTGLCDTQL